MAILVPQLLSRPKYISTAQAESLRYKLLGGLLLAIRRFIMENGAKGCEVIVSGKLIIRAQRAKSMKFKDGYATSEKLILALIHATRRLRRYFKDHPIRVLTDKPFERTFLKPDGTRRVVKWAKELEEYDIEYGENDPFEGQSNELAETCESSTYSNKKVLQVERKEKQNIGSLKMCLVQKKEECLEFGAEQQASTKVFLVSSFGETVLCFGFFIGCTMNGLINSGHEEISQFYTYMAEKCTDDLVWLCKLERDMTSFKGFSKGIARFSKGFSKGVARFSKGFSKGVAPFSKGVACFSSECVTASRGCVTACSKESNSETQKEEPKPKFMVYKTSDHVTLKLKAKTGIYELDKVVAATEGVRSFVADDENGKAHVSGLMHPKFIRRMRKLKGKVDIDHIQFGECSSNLYRKKEAPPKKEEAPSTKNACPSTNDANPTTNNANTTIIITSLKAMEAIMVMSVLVVMEAMIISVIMVTVATTATFNYQPRHAVYQKRIGYDHIDCAGDASECSGDHIGKAVTPDKTQDKSSKNTVEKPADSSKRN
ncbi:hypothetical protein CTI12_AA376020 [Artemisia annua]|uniref:Reverse transcriptase RNase H-like domain-containing protein n=1 Tax=Artemisia annua TaxID=35608 RepID=A0A2U1MIL9_ARTAN|nr:hypothetical protein CTI12_AA376020 [Artemisia annua]